MKTIETTVYKFSELSNEAKETAIRKQRENEYYLDYEWWDCIYEGFKETAKDKGFDVDKIYFSGFWSQGDGAMFEGSVDFNVWKPTNIDRRVVRCIDSGLIDLYWSVKHRGHYYHSGCRKIDFDGGNGIPYTWKSGIGATGRIIDELDKIEQQLEEDYEDLCSDLYRSLEKEYEYLMSDEVITEELTANDYDFTEDGKRY